MADHGLLIVGSLRLMGTTLPLALPQTCDQLLSKRDVEDGGGREEGSK
jgi:hypothetical protein